MLTLVYHTDEGCRKGCHPISKIVEKNGKREYVRLFSVDEPGAWWEDAWNCHVDGQDIRAEGLPEALAVGMSHYGETDYFYTIGGAFE